MNRGRARGGNVGFGFGRGRGGGRGGGGGHHNNNDSESLTACIPQGIDWHASEPPKDYIFGQGRGEEGFTTGIVRPIDNPLEILRNQRRAQELAEKNKNGGALSEVSTILDAADAAAREDERRARIQALTGQHQHQQGSTNNNNNNSNNRDEEQLISAIPEVGKIMVDAGERKDRERERRMEAADVVDLLLPSTNASSMLMVSSADQNRSREAILEKLKQSSKNSTTTTTMKNPSSKDVRDLLVGVTTAGSSTGEDENNSGDATEEEISSGGVEFDKIMIGNMNSNYDPESLKGYRRLTENSILRDPKSSEQEFLKLAQIDIIESGGDVRAGYQTILRGTKETGGHSSLLWLTAAKFANDFFNDNIRAKELCKTGLVKMMENLMSASVLIPREPAAKNYAIMINFVNYAIELFSASTTASVSHSNDENARNNNNNNNNTTSSIAEEEKQDERNMEVLEILRQAVVLAPLHDPFWEQLFFLEDASQHREILTVSMKSIRESKLKIPVTLWVRLAKLEMKLVTQNDHQGQQQQQQQQLNRVKKVTEAGLKDHPSSPALWLIQAIAMTKMERAEHNQQQDDVATSNTTAAVTKSLKSAVDAVFDSQRQNNNNNHHHPHHHQDMTLMFKSWFTTCLDLVSLSSSTSSNEDKITNDIKSELTNKSTCSSSSFITRIAIREFLIKVFCTSKNSAIEKEDDSSSSNLITNDDISLMEALRAVTEDSNFFPSSSSSSVLSPASAPSTVIQSRVSFLNQKKNTQQKQNQKYTPEILSRLNLSILVFETLIELVINPQQSGTAGRSRFTFLRHFETVLRSLALCVDHHHILVNDGDDNIVDKILTRLLSSLLMLSFSSSASSYNKIFLNACSAVKLFLQQSEEEARFSKILSACNNTHDDENAKGVLELTKQAFGLASSSSSSRTANTNIVLKQENKEEDAAEEENSSLRIQQQEESRLFNFYYEKAIQFTHLLTSQEFNTNNTNNSNLTPLVENLTKIEEDIKNFVSSSSSLVSSSPVSIVNHLVYRTQLLSSIRTAKWQVEELMMMTKNSNIDPPPISFEDLLENNIVDISYDCRLILHSILFLSNRSSSSSSSSFKSKAILDQQIQLVEGKVTRAIDEKEAMIRQNAPTDRIQACMIVIQRKTNTLCHLIAARVFFDKDDPVNRIRVMDRFASSSKTVWRRGVLASFSRCRRSFETSSSLSGLSSLFSIDPLLLLVQNKSNSSLIESLKSNFDKNCLFASSSATLDSSAVTTRSLILFPPSTATPYDGTNCRPGLPSLDLLMRLFIEVTPASSSSSGSGGTSSSSSNAKAAVLKNQMSFIKEIAMSNPNAFSTAAAASSPPPFPLLYLAASDLYTKAGKHERAVQEACKALDAAFEMNSHKPTSLSSLSLSSSSSVSSSNRRLLQNEEFEDCQSFTPSSFDSIFGSTSGLEFVTEIVWKKNVIVKMTNNGGNSSDQELEKVIGNIGCCLAQGF